MKNKDFKELKTKSAESLTKEIERLRKEKDEAKIERDMTKAKNTHRILSIKRDIARLMTLINEKSFVATKEKPDVSS